MRECGSIEYKKTVICYLSNKLSKERDFFCFVLFLLIVKKKNQEEGKKLFRVKNDGSTNTGGYKLTIFMFRIGNQVFYNHWSSWVQEQLPKQKRRGEKSDNLCNRACKVHERIDVRFQWQETRLDNMGGGFPDL